MKKSEMIDIIEIQLSEHYPPSTDYRIFAEKLLKRMEELGMKSPHTMVLNCNCYDHNWDNEE